MKSIQIQQFLQNQLPIPSQLLSNYSRLGLNEQEVIILLQIHRFMFQENPFPTPDELASCVTMNNITCSKILRGLIQKGFLAIEQMRDDDNKLGEYYSLDSLWDKLYTLNEEIEGELPKKNEDGQLFILFEQEFGRPLSPFEIETVNVWLDEDHIKPPLIKAALRESVLMGKLNFKYIDRMLRDWKRKGIKTMEQAQRNAKAFHQHQQTKPEQDKPTKRDTSFYYNWLEGEEE